MKSELCVGGVNYSHIGRRDEKAKRDIEVRTWFGGKEDIKMYLFRAYSPAILGNMMLQLGNDDSTKPVSGNSSMATHTYDFLE